VTQKKNANNKTTNGVALSTTAEIQIKPQKGKVESIGQEDPWFKQAASKGVHVLPLPFTHLGGSVYMHQICVWQHVKLGEEKA
jgi:PIN domain nuclease of toxin-antitoxin system